MILLTFQLFLAFLIANLLGYGGGPASIPLMYDQVVNAYKWMGNEDFSSMLALGNSLPGPIATKIAAFVGFEVGGWPGFIAALIATIVPSAIALILLLRVMQKHKQSPVVKGMSLLVQPVIAVMMLLLTYNLSIDSLKSIGPIHSLLIAVLAFFALVKFKIHPAIVIVCSFVYGAFIIPIF
ncbi:chromate transporter [Bacillus massiliigorillae]|uniref:chromate transporter n=1 Tax=Bacillus massiliigorillae TaxID=1243664 RepID=UPI0003A994EB|nr:chromate transporter [Bacillus massiliigorillae]